MWVEFTEYAFLPVVPLGRRIRLAVAVREVVRMSATRNANLILLANMPTDRIPVRRFELIVKAFGAAVSIPVRESF